MSRAGSRADSINTSLGSSTEEDSDLPVAQLQDAVAAGTAQTANLAFGQLPDQDTNDENIEDAYVQFILYCNPSLSRTLPTIGLRRAFHAVPRADGKSFEVFELFKLMQKLQHGEIGSWNSLVVELGVDRPDPSKNQSSQKLGQYAVRLKVSRCLVDIDLQQRVFLPCGNRTWMWFCLFMFMAVAKVFYIDTQSYLKITVCVNIFFDYMHLLSDLTSLHLLTLSSAEVASELPHRRFLQILHGRTARILYEDPK